MSRAAERLQRLSSRARRRRQNARDRRFQIRLHEYESLQQRVLLDSRASYTLMAALVALSEGILAAALTNLHNLTFTGRVGASVASLSALLFWYPVDRRFVWAERRRLARVDIIERELSIYNQRIFDEWPEIDDVETAEAVEDVDEELGVFARISIHHLYLVLVLLMVVAWILIVLS